MRMKVYFRENLRKVDNDTCDKSFTEKRTAEKKYRILHINLQRTLLKLKYCETILHICLHKAITKMVVEHFYYITAIRLF